MSTRDRLIRLNRTTGVGTEVGSCRFWCSVNLVRYALAWDDTDLWMVGGTRESINTTGFQTCPVSKF